MHIRLSVSWLYNFQYLTFPHDQVLGTVDSDLGACILTVKHGIAGLNSNRFVFFSWTGSQNGTTLWFLLRRIGNNNTACSLLLSSSRLHDHPVMQGGNV